MSIRASSFFPSERESAMKLGRAWNYPPLQESETIISSSLANALSLSPGDTLHLSVNISRYLDTIADDQLLS